MGDYDRIRAHRKEKEEFAEANSDGDFGGIQVERVIYYPNGATIEIDTFGGSQFYWVGSDSYDVMRAKRVAKYWEMAVDIARDELAKQVKFEAENGPCTGGSVSLGKRMEERQRINPPYKKYWVEVEDIRPMSQKEIDKENRDRKKKLRKLRSNVKYAQRKYSEASERLDEMITPVQPIYVEPTPAEQEWQDEINEIGNI